MKSKKFTKILLAIAFIIGVLAGLTYWQYHSAINTPIDPDNDTEISFQVRKGETPKEIAQNLVEKELIRSNWAFYLHVKFNNLAENIIAGRFLLNKTMAIPEIVETISNPSQAEFIITIQEGLTIKDIDQKLSELGLTEASEFLTAVKEFSGWEYYSFLDQNTLQTLDSPIEGYLYPDTYFLNPQDFQAHDAIYLTMDNFEQKTAGLLPKIKEHTIHEIITMASIIENEVVGSEDKKLVSGILWKRLENDWTLGADAALLYITDDREITAKDLEIDSPYNLRKNKGLPPGPICNPSLESIEAAMYPEKSEYWFYLTTIEGEVIYAKTNEEHNGNKAKYL